LTLDKIILGVYFFMLMHVRVYQRTLTWTLSIMN